MRRLTYIRLPLLQRVILGCTVLSTLLILYSLYVNKNKRVVHSSLEIKSDCDYVMPVIKMYGSAIDVEAMEIVRTMFQTMGYRLQTHDLIEWDVLWSHTYPFYSLKNELRLLKPHQKINHFPGSGSITQKSNLVKLDLPHIPKSFLLPREKELFSKFAQIHKNKTWVLKSSTHRGIRLLNGSEDLNGNNSFVQEYIQNPLLINNKKFDIGIYTILTSVDPLRAYMYSSDILLRFCKSSYDTLVAASPESYVVGDDYLPIWEVDDLKMYFTELNYTAKESLNAYLQNMGKRKEKMWAQIQEAIQNVYLKTEDSLLKSAMRMGSLRNYFELVRFDFMADNELNVYLLEVNMSPNLSTAHFHQNRLLYEQIVFNTLNIMGLTRTFHTFFEYSITGVAAHFRVWFYPAFAKINM